VIATVSDLRAFFAVIDKPPAEVTPADVFEFIASQRRCRGDGRVVRLSDGKAGLAARTIRRRLAVMSGLFNYLVLCGEMAANPVPRGMATGGVASLANLERRRRREHTRGRDFDGSRPADPDSIVEAMNTIVNRDHSSRDPPTLRASSPISSPPHPVRSHTMT